MLFLFIWNILRRYVIFCFTRSDFYVWLWNKYFIISSSLIGFFSLVVYVVSFHLNYCSKYVFCYVTRSDYFVRLWNDYYLITSSLINCLLAQICMLFLKNWIIVVGMFLAVLKEVLSLYICERIIIVYQVYWFINSWLT